MVATAVAQNQGFVDPDCSWPAVAFGDCAVLIKATVSPSEKGDAHYVGLEHIGEGTLSLVGSGVASDVTSAKTQFRRGDILFGKLRPYFRKVVSAPFSGICSTDIWVVRATEGVDQDYLYYCMADPQFVDFVTAGSTGTKMPRANWDHASTYMLSLPPLPEQRCIADFLRALDDKIELNRRMAETLDQMARALFKSWFVDFDPVRAKMDGRWQRGDSLLGVPAELYDLFPDHFVEGELNTLPDGWAIQRLLDFAVVNPESWSRNNAPEDVEYVDLANTKWGTVERTYWYSWSEAPSRARRVLRLGDTVVGMVRPGNGSYAFIGREGLTGSTGFAVLRPSSNFYREWVYLAATDPVNIVRLALRADGAAYPAVLPEVVGETEAAVPSDPDELLKRFS